MSTNRGGYVRCRWPAAALPAPMQRPPGKSEAQISVYDLIWKELSAVPGRLLRHQVQQVAVVSRTSRTYETALFSNFVAPTSFRCMLNITCM